MFEAVQAVASHIPGPTVPVSVQGLSWGATASWVLVVLLTAGLGALAKIWPKLKQLNNESDASLRHDLMKEIEALRTENRDERRDCDRRMAEMQKAYEAEISELRGEIRGLRDNIIQNAKSGDVLRLHANAPSATAKFAGEAK